MRFFGSRNGGQRQAEDQSSSSASDGCDVAFTVTILAVCLLYGVSALVGRRLARDGRLDMATLVATRRTLTDPLTRRFQEWSRREKMNAIREQRWSRLQALILANNLGAVAFVGRTLYGIAVVPALYITWRQGLSHGVLAAQPSMRLRGQLLVVAGLEFGAYLLATALGVNLLVTPVTGGAVTDALRMLLVLYPVIALALLIGAWLEVRALRTRMPEGLRLPPGLSMDELRAKALDALSRRSGGNV